MKLELKLKEVIDFFFVFGEFQKLLTQIRRHPVSQNDVIEKSN